MPFTDQAKIAQMFLHVWRSEVLAKMNTLVEDTMFYHKTFFNLLIQRIVRLKQIVGHLW